jgi:hypothetical protein
VEPARPTLVISEFILMQSTPLAIVSNNEFEYGNSFTVQYVPQPTLAAIAPLLTSLRVPVRLTVTSEAFAMGSTAARASSSGRSRVLPHRPPLHHRARAVRHAACVRVYCAAAGRARRRARQRRVADLRERHHRPGDQRHGRGGRGQLDAARVAALCRHRLVLPIAVTFDAGLIWITTAVVDAAVDTTVVLVAVTV